MAYAPQTPLMASTLPPDVYQGAMAAQLGDQPRAEYRATTTGKRIVLALVYLIIGIVLAGIGLGSLSQSTDSSSLPVAAILGLLGLLLVGAAFYNFLYGVIYRNWRVYVYERGFIHKKGSEVAQPFRWDQIEAVWYNVVRHYRRGIYTGTTHSYRVRRQDGYEIVLNDRFTKVAALGEIVSNQVTGAKFPQVMAAYNAGQTITFGPLSVNNQGIQSANGNFLPWPEIKDVSIQRGFVAVSKAGTWLRWSSQPMRDIPNVFLFITTVKFLLKK